MTTVNKKPLPKTLQGYGRVPVKKGASRPNMATTQGNLGIPPRKADYIGTRGGVGFVEGARSSGGRVNSGHPKA